MIKIIKFNNEQRTYMFPNGAIATPEVIKSQFPAVENFTHILEINGDVCQAVQNLSAMRTFYNIDESLTEDEAILAIETIINTFPVIEPTAEERIAAAMEYQNLLTL